MNISPNHIELSGSFGAFCFHREFLMPSAKPTTIFVRWKMFYKWLLLLWTGCIPGHPASTPLLRTWWSLAKTRYAGYCSEKACNSQGLTRLLQGGPAVSSCLRFPSGFTIKIEACLRFLCLCNERSTKVEREGSHSSFFSSSHVQQFNSTASVAPLPREKGLLSYFNAHSYIEPIEQSIRPPNHPFTHPSIHPSVG